MKIFSLALRTTTALTGCAAKAATAARNADCVAGLNTFARPAGSSKTIQPRPSGSTEWVTGGTLLMGCGFWSD